MPLPPTDGVPSSLGSTSVVPSTVQVALQPSPLTRLPSSHSSMVAVWIVLPQATARPVIAATYFTIVLLSPYSVTWT